MIFGKTKSVCPVCLRVLDAQKRAEEDGVYLDKTCPEHGSFSALIWEGNLASYTAWNRENRAVDPPREGKEPEKGCPLDCGLCTAHQRKGCCVLLELTRRCDLHCPVCFASAGEGGDMSIDEIAAQYDWLMAHGGPFNIQLSGGEPTMRDDLPSIIRLGREKGFTFFQLNTNGLRLAAEPDYAHELVAAGLNTVFLQFDGLDDKVYQVLRGRPLLEQKKRCVESCAAAGLGVVLVPVIAAGVNEEQLFPILRYALDNSPAVRGVHIQPVSYFGRCALERPARPLTIPAVLRLIETQSEGLLHSSDFSGGGAENPYCSFHAAYRIRPDGSLKPLPRRDGVGSCCTGSDDSRVSVAEQWSGESCCCGGENKLSKNSAFDEFLSEIRRRTFTISGMVFQDAWNLDLERLKCCHICEADERYGMVPFCSYNLTATDGRTLYR